MRNARQYLFFFMMGALIFGATEVRGAEKSTKNGRATATFDRLAWLAGLIERLKNSPAPICVGPRGCSMDIPADSPCTKPVNEQPDVIVDGVLPGALASTWVVAYRLMCSECYLGGSAHILLARVDNKGWVHIIERMRLQTERDDEIPSPVEMKSEDVDADGRLEMIIRFQSVRERSQKCTGMQDASSYMVIVRTEKQHIVPVLNEQLEGHPTEKGRPFTETVRFNDEDDDGYPDLIVTRTELPDVHCETKGANCNLEGTAGTHTTVTVKRYVEDAADWSAPPVSGHALGPGDGIDCDVPMSETPFAVVAGTLPGRALTKAMEEKAAALRQAGFGRTCLYNGSDFKGLKPDHFYLIVSAHETRGSADEEANLLRKAAFRPFVKQLFE